MAITRLVDVFPAHKRRVLAAALTLQLGLLGIVALLLLLNGFDWVVILLFVLLPVAVLQTFAFIVISNYALEPLDYLARTVIQVSDQPHVTTPPNLNGTRHERTGIKLMIDTIYKLAINGPGVVQTDHPTSTLQETILDTVPGGIIAMNEKREILYANKAAPLSVDRDGQNHIQLMFDEHDSLDSWLSTVENTQVSGERVWRRIQNVLPGEENRKVYDVSVSYQKNGVGGIDTLILLFDQTKYYAVGEDGMEFMALAAHELRGPMTVIRGYLDILRPQLEPNLTNEQRQLFDRLDVSSSRLSGYVSNVLNASKFDRRHLRLHLQEEKIDMIYQLVADDLALRASTQGKILTVTIPPDLPTIAADRNSLSEVIANLTDNAIKYSREGSQVIITAAVDGDTVRLSVQDFGIGIPSSVVGNLFSKFYRSHRSKQNISGTGLGLYISKAIVESHGGKIGLTSSEGEGSTFSFNIPIYSTVADKLKQTNSANNGIIETSSGWIKNHSMYRG